MGHKHVIKAKQRQVKMQEENEATTVAGADSTNPSIRRRSLNARVHERETKSRATEKEKDKAKKESDEEPHL